MARSFELKKDSSECFLAVPLCHLSDLTNVFGVDLQRGSPLTLLLGSKLGRESSLPDMTKSSVTTDCPQHFSAVFNAEPRESAEATLRWCPCPARIFRGVARLH